VEEARLIHPFPVPRAALAAAVLALGVACGGGDDLERVGGPCSSKSKCQQGLVCLAGKCAVEAPAAPTCNPATHTPTISYAGTVGPPDDPGTCDTSVRTALSPSAEHVGTFDVGATTPAFTIADGTVSFSILSQATGDTPETVSFNYQGADLTIANWPVPRFVRAPGGRVFYDDIRDYWASDPAQTHSLEAFYAGIVAGVGAFTTPNTSRGLDLLYTGGQLQPGGWNLTVGDLAYLCATDVRLGCGAGGSLAGTYDITVIPKAGPLASTGTLDLSVYFVTDPTAGATGADTWDGPAFGQLVSSMQLLFGRLGICLGQVKVHDLPDWARTRYSTLATTDGGRCGDLAQLSTLSSPADGGVHLFLVDGFDVPGLAGIDGSIAGPSGVPGTTTSGAAVGLGEDLVFSGQCIEGDFDPAHCGPDSLAYVAAHEAGHWLGLFHTTEASGELWDPLDDTGACDCSCYSSAADRSACSAGTKDLLTLQCLSATNSRCQGGENLMFWLFSPGNSRGSVSPQQGRVARLNPAVH
jgi:hypothetical protein